MVLSKEELLLQCPPLALNQIIPVRGRRRIKIPTINVVEDMLELGWQPVETHVKKSKSKNARHAVVFALPNLSFGIKTVKDIVVPQITLIGDNGNSPFRIYVAFLRKRCGTRLNVPVKYSKQLTLKNFYISFRSKDYSRQFLDKTLTTLMNSIVENSKKLFEFIDMPLTEEQRRFFAASAYLRRQNVRPGLISKRADNVPSLTVDLLLAAFRQQDLPDNVWYVLARVHEKVVRGFKTFPTQRSKRLFQYKSLVNFEKIIHVSIQLYLDVYKLYLENEQKEDRP